jgi:hypothetical protein
MQGKKKLTESEALDARIHEIERSITLIEQGALNDRFARSQKVERTETLRPAKTEEQAELFIRKDSATGGRKLPEIAYIIPVLLAVIAVGVLIAESGMTGWVTGGQKYDTYVQEVNAEITGSQEMTLALTEHPETFNLRSIKFSGHMTGKGTAKAYIEGPDGKKYVVIDQTEIAGSGMNAITAYAVSVFGLEQQDQELTELEDPTLTAEQPKIQATAAENTELHTANEEETAASTAEASVTESQEPTPEETLPDNTPAAEKSVTTVLSYGNSQQWDTDNDGEAYEEDGVVDLTVENSAFSWETDETKLCTKWTVTSIDTGESITICNGAGDCCALSGVAPEENRWDAPLYLFQGKYGATAENTVTAQVVFLNQSAGEEVYFDSAVGDAKSLSARFVKKPVYNFREACVQTCMLPDGFEQDEYRIVFEIEEGVTLYIANVTYSIEEIKQGLQNSTNTPANNTARNGTIELIPAIRDSKGNTIPAVIEFIDEEGQTSTISETGAANNGRRMGVMSQRYNTLTLPPGRYKARINLTRPDSPVKLIDINDIDITENSSRFLRFENLPATGKHARFNQIYAIDPTSINATNMTITATASGSILYKCAEWDFDNQECTGEWAAIADIRPGQDYNITINATDPGLAEGNGTFFEGWESNSLSTNSWTQTGTGNDCIIVTWAVYSGTYTLQCMPFGAENSIQTNISTLGHTNITFSFYATTSGLDSGEYISADWYNGTGWTNLMPQTQEIPSHTLYSYTLPTSANNNPDLKIRFNCYAGSNNERCYIDNVQVNGTTASSENSTAIDVNGTIYDAQNSTITTKLEIFNQTGEEVYNNTSNTHQPHISKGEYNIRITPSANIVKGIRINNASLRNSNGKIIAIDDPSDNQGFLELYAVNPLTNFTNATITATAKGNILYKCANWNFAARTCDGSWAAVADIRPGQDYNITINATDPGLAEGNGTFFEGWESNSLSTNNWTTGGTGSPCWIVGYTAYAGTYALRCMPYGAETTIETNVSTAGYTNVSFSFYTVASGLDAGEYFAADWYNGTGWTQLVSAQIISSYTLYNYSLGAAANNNPNMKIRFRCSAGSNNEDCYIDNIQVTGTYANNDTTPPAAVTNLANRSAGTTWIYWNWTNPNDSDFSAAIIYINNSNTANTSNNYYNATGLSSNKTYIMRVNTKDTSGNVNTTNVNSTASTLNTTGNQAPTQGTPVLNSTTGANTTSENLTCYSQNTYDENGDPVKNIFNWQRNSTSISLLNMPFEGGSNTTYTRDYSGNGNNGAVNGSTWSSTSGYDGKGAYGFDGLNDYINIGAPASLNFAGNTSFTIAARVKVLGGTNTHRPIVVKGDTQYTLKIYTNNTFESCAYDGAWKCAYSISNLTQGSWYHLVGRFGNGNVSLWVNGTYQNSNTYSGITTNAYNVNIGRDAENPTRLFNGTIDEVLILNRALTSQEINYLYQTGTDRIVSQEAAPGDIWKCSITPNDGIVDGNTTDSNTVTLVNGSGQPANDTTPPAINSISDSPDPVEHGQTITITANVTDSTAVSSVTFGINVTNYSVNRSSLPWTQTTPSDFNAGTMNNTNVTYAGSVILNPTFSTTTYDGAGYGLADPQAITTVDGSTFWLFDKTDDTVYKVDSSWSLIASYSVGSTGCGDAWGMTTDNGTYFWLVDYSDDKVYKFNSTFGLITSYNNPSNDNYGITTVNGTEFWLTDWKTDVIYRVDISFGIINTTPLPAAIGDTTGIDTIDGTEFWIADYSDKVIYHTNSTFQIIDLFDIAGAGAAYPTDATTTDGQTFWFPDETDDVTYKRYPTYSASGTIESQAFNAGRVADWLTIAWTEDLPAGADITMQVATSSDGSSWGAWSTPAGESGASITANDSQYIKWRANLTTISTAVTPLLKDATIYYPSDQLWSRSFNSSIWTVGTYNYTAYANDTYGNNATPQGGNFTIQSSDTTPPATVTNLTSTAAGDSWIRWAWTNPADTDFAAAILYINGSNIGETACGNYNASGLLGKKTYQLTVRTRDNKGNVNTTNVSSTANTTNSVPTQGTPTLTSTLGTNKTTENLTVYAQSLADANGDPIKQIINWKRNSNSITVLNMPFESTGGNETSWTRDYTNISSHGTVTGSGWSSSLGHDGWGAYHFDGNDYIRSLHATNFDFSDFTYAVWIKTNDTSASWKTILDVDNDAQQFAVTTGYALYGRCGSKLHGTAKANVWVHLVWTVEGGNYRLYENGTLIGSGSGCSASINGAGMGIGSDSGGTGEFFLGMIDDVRIYNRAISAEQALAIFNNHTDKITADDTTSGETWQACITPTDGTGDGTTECSNTLTIASNNVPTASNVALSSTYSQNTSSENITVSATTYDADSDTVKKIHTWYRNNTPVAVLYLPFEGGSNSTYTPDRSGGGRHGTVSSATWSQTGGYDGRGAYSFGSTSTYINPGTNFTFADKITVSAWVKQNSFGNYVRYVERGQSSCASPWLNIYLGTWAGVDSNKPRFAVQVTASALAYHSVPSFTMTAGQWYHLVGTYDGSHVKLYANGNLIATGSGTGNIYPSTNPMSIGYPIVGCADAALDGYLDDILIINQTISPDEVREMYNNRTDLVASNRLNFGDTWKSCVTPDDNTNAGTANCSNNLTITANNIPSSSAAATFNQGTNLNTSNTTLSWNITHTDTYQTVRNITNWYINGSSFEKINLQFEGTGGNESTWAKDHSGSQNHITVHTAEWGRNSGIDGTGGYTFTTDPTLYYQDYLESKSNIQITGNSPRTMCAWIKCNQTTTYGDHNIIGYGAIQAGKSFSIIQKGDEWYFGGVSADYEPNVAVNTSWVHNCVTYDSTTLNYYINGVSVGSTSLSLNTSASHLIMGIRQDLADVNTHWNGSIDDVLIYNTSLTQTQIQNIYNRRKDILTGSVLHQGDTVYAKFTPNDGYVDGTTVQTGNVTVNGDITAPATVTSLTNRSAGSSWIYWNWTNPADSDFNHTEVYLNGTFMANASKPANYYNATGLSDNRAYQIQTRTADHTGNINTTWVNSTASTRPADSIAPTWSNNRTKPATGTAYSYGAAYQFNVTWNDTTAVHTVRVEHNFTGTPANYSATGNASGEHYYNYSNLAAGTYVWRMHANDTYGYTNATSQWTYTVNKATPTCELTFDKSSPQTYGTTLNASCSCTQGTPKLYRNNTDVTSTENNTLTTLPAGTYSYTCNTTGTQNYSTTTNTTTFTINKEASILTLNATPGWSATYGTQTTVNCTSNTPQSIPQLYRNGTLVSMPDTQTLGAASYNYTCNTTATQNYTGNTTTNTLTINKASTTTAAYINGSTNNLTITYGAATNATATTTAGTMTLYRNGTQVSNPEIATLAAGYYNYTAINNGDSNYTGSSATLFVTVNKASTTTTMHLNGTQNNITITYTQALNASYTTNSASATMYRNGTDVSSQNNTPTTLAAGYYNYTAINNGNENYTGSNITLFVTVNKAESSTILLLNSSSANITAERLSYVNITASKTTGDNVSIHLYRNGTLTSSGIGPLTDNTQYSQEGDYNITVMYNESTNYTASSQTYWILVRDTTRPGSISNLGESGAGADWIRWIWTNPTDPDFAQAILYLNGTNIANTSNNYYNVTNLTGYSSYRLTVRTKDNSGNINTTNVSDNAMTMDNIAPQYSNLSDQNNTAYAPGKNYQFNITWTDNVAMSQVTFELDGTNHTDPTAQGSTYYYTKSDLAAGNHTYRWYATDFLGNANSTPTIQFSVSKGAVNLTISASPGWNTTYGTQTTINCTADTLQASPQLYRNGTNFPIPDTQTLAAGTYQYTCNSTETQNYTNTTATATLTVNKAQTATTMLLNGSAANLTATYGAATNASSSSDTGTPTIYMNGTQVSNPDIATLAAGYYNYTAINNGDSNHTGSSATLFLTVQKAGSAVTLLLNSSSSNRTIERASYANITAYMTSGDNTPIYIYRNGTEIASGTGTLTDTSQYNEQADYNITAEYPESSNYTASSSTHWLLVRDTTPPGIAGSLNESSKGSSWIYWNWTNPADTDFAQAIIYLNGTNVANTSNSFYNATDLSTYTTYQITIRTKDTYGNINTTNTSDTATTTDSIPPQYSGIKDANGTTYSPGNNYQFNITWTDNVGIGSVAFELDGTNHTNPEQSGNEFHITQNDLAAGEHTYRWHATDLQGNTNSTETRQFTILKATTTLNITASPGWSITYGVQTTISCTPSNTEANATLYRNETPTATPDTQTLAGGNYTYTCNSTATQNYSTATATGNLSINRAASSTSMLLNGTGANITIEVRSAVNETGISSAGIGNIEIYENGTPAASGTSPLTKITAYNTTGAYNITALQPENQNYTSSSETHWIIATDSTPPAVNHISPGDAYATANHTVQFTFNFTDNYHSTASCTLYLNGTPSGTNTSAAAGISTTITNTSVPEGNYSWHVNCTDGSGNSGTGTERAITADFTPPTITPVRPVDNETIGYIVIFAVDAADNLVGVDKVYVLSRNSTGTPVFAGIIPPPYRVPINTSVYPDGQYNITAWVNDTLGNTAQRSVIHYISNLMPFAQILTPEGGSIIRTLFNFTVTLQDDSLDTSTCKITSLNGTVVFNHTHNLYGQTYFSEINQIDPSSWEDGNYTVTIWVNDTIGYSTNETLQFTVDKTSPQYSAVNEPTDPSTYSPGAIYNFNITWEDNTAIELVRLEFNGTNHTDIETSGSNYADTMTDLAGGTYTYRWFAKDTAGNWNSTEYYTFTVAKATASCLLSFDKSSPQTYGTGITANCTCLGQEAWPRMWRNNTNVTSTENNIEVMLAGGDYAYICNRSESRNYTSAKDSATFTISRAARTVNLTILPGNEVTYGTETTAACTASTGESTPLLQRNGTTAEIPDTQTLAAGNYSYNCSAAETRNYTGAGASATINVNKAASVLNLKLNGSSSDRTIERATTLNISAARLAGTGPIALYRNGTILGSGANVEDVSPYGISARYNITALYPETQNHSAGSATYFLTVNDTIPPGAATSMLLLNRGQNYIYWVWTNPSDEDFARSEVYINKSFKTSSTAEYYYATSLNHSTYYTISVRTVDSSGVYGPWTNSTNRTEYNCTENWIAAYLSCGPNDTRVKWYNDTNTCGTHHTLPPDNGTSTSCDYISSLKFNGNTTNFTRDSLTGLEGVILETREYGRITFQEPITIERSLDLDSNADIGARHASISSGSIPEFNKSANITLYSINFTSPRIMEDGNECADECKIISYENGSLTFNVTHFTNYSVDESPYCGDTQCNGAEDCASCALDCGSCASPGAGGGGGGSGGGGNAPKKEEEPCVPNWLCYSWGTCVSYQQTRKCFDANACGDDTGMPDTLRSCITGCAERWACGEWNKCAEAGIQTRECNDRAACGTEHRKPITVQPCAYEHCNDGRRNFDEEAPDCGGSCKKCTKEDIAKAKEEARRNLLTGEAIALDPYEPENPIYILPILLLLVLLITTISLQKANISERVKKALTISHILLVISIVFMLIVTFNVPEMTGRAITGVANNTGAYGITGMALAGAALMALLAYRAVKEARKIREVQTLLPESPKNTKEQNTAKPAQQKKEPPKDAPKDALQKAPAEKDTQKEKTAAGNPQTKDRTGETTKQTALIPEPKKETQATKTQPQAKAATPQKTQPAQPDQEPKRPQQANPQANQQSRTGKDISEIGNRIKKLREEISALQSGGRK